MAPPWPSADHLTRCLRAHDPRASHVGLEQPVEVLDRRSVPGHEGVDRSVRHDVVEAPPALSHLLYHGLDGLRVAHVGDHGEGLPARLLHQPQRLAGIAGRPLVHCDESTFGGEAHRRGLPDAGGGSRDKSHLAHESTFHDVLLRATACSGHSVSAVARPPGVRTADQDQKMAMGFQGEPVAPGRRRGSPTTRNSQRPSCSQASAKSSSCRLSEMHIPIAVSCSGWMG